MCSYETMRWLLYGNNGDPEELLKLYPDFVPTITKENGFPYFHYACIKNHEACVRGLVKCGANLKWKNKQGFTPLFYACWFPSKYRSPEKIEKQYKLLKWMLCNHGARSTINWNDNLFKLSPLHMLLENPDNSKIVLLLLNNGADPTTYDSCKRAYAPINPQNERLMMSVAQISQAGEWRPWNHSKYPPKYKKTMVTLAILARSTLQ